MLSHAYDRNIVKCKSFKVDTLNVFYLLIYLSKVFKCVVFILPLVRFYLKAFKCTKGRTPLKKIVSERSLRCISSLYLVILFPVVPYQGCCCLFLTHPFMVLCPITGHCDILYVTECLHVCVPLSFQMMSLPIAERLRHPSPSTPLINICGVLWLEHRPGRQVYVRSKAGDVLIHLTDAQGVITLHSLSFSLSFLYSEPV